MSDTLDHTDRETLYVTDAELIRRAGVPEKIMRATLRKLDSNGASGFPKKNELFGNRRYWPAVRAYLDRLHGVKMAVSQQGESHERRAARH